MRLVGISANGCIETHIPGATGDYATLCGLDGCDMHEHVQQKEVEASTMVTCPDCVAIWKVARKIKPGQIGCA